MSSGALGLLTKLQEKDAVLCVLGADVVRIPDEAA